MTRRHRLATLFAAVLLGLGAEVASAQTYTDLYHLSDVANGDGSHPRGPLTVEESSGQVLLHGTAAYGGQSDAGTAFSYVVASGTYSSQSFDGTNGQLPMGGVTLTSSGLFGTAYQGGGSSLGTVWAGTSGLQAIHTFAGSGQGSSPAGPLLALLDPTTFWGTTSDSMTGVVFRISFDPIGGGWIYTVLHPLDPINHSFSGLIQASNGSLYGTTSNTAFRIDPDGSNFADVGPALADQYNFTLLQASDGYLYGRGDHEIFRMDLSGGNFSVLRTLSVADGHDFGPFGGALLEGSDGLLYGTNDTGGANGLGTIFRIGKDGSHFVVLHDFAGPEGSGSSSGLVRDSAGHFYGTASGGGDHGDGVIFQFDPAPGPWVIQLIPTAGPVFVEPGDPVQVVGQFFPASSGLSVGGLPSNAISVPDDQHISANTPPGLNPGTLNDVVVSDPDTGAVGVLKEGWFADFLDVPGSTLFHGGVESIVRAKITAGCGGGNFCPTAPVTRAQMAVFLLKGEHGSGYTPPPCTGIFSDVSCSATPDFAADWIEQLYGEGITAGCGPDIYCPTNPVSRQQMAVFLLKAEHGVGYVPPACAGVFVDVPCGTLFADWIEELYAEQITGGCLMNPLSYCPLASASRGQMAAFLTKVFQL